MAVFNVPNYLAKDGFGMSLNIRRGNPNPLDNSSVWASLEAAQNYAMTDPVAYVGQILTVVSDVVVDDVTVKTATAYVIDNEAGDLKEVGSSPVGDEKTITVSENGTVSLVGIAGLALTREEEDGSTTKISYQPLLVDGKLTWVEPSATTVEGLATEIEGIKTRLSTLETTVGKAAEGDAEATGLIKAVADNAGAIEALEEKVGEKTVAEQIADAIAEKNLKGVIYSEVAPTGTTEGVPGQIYVYDAGRNGTEIYICEGYYVPMGETVGSYRWEHISLETENNTKFSNIQLAIDDLMSAVGEDDYEGTLFERIATIEGDYLKSDDKTELEGKITEAANKAKEDAVAAIMGEAGIDEKYDTLREVADWILADTTSSAELITRITNIETDYLKGADKTELQGAIDDLEAFVGALPEGATSETVVGYIQEVVDALKISDYAKAADLTALANRVAAVEALVGKTSVSEQIATAIANKVDKVEGSRLMTDVEGTKLAGIAEGAQVNVIDTVDEAQFAITGKHLTLLDVAMGRVTGLTDALAGKVDKVEGSRLLTEDEATKLEKLVLGENGEVSVSGKVAAGNVDGLDAWITARAGTLEGLSENNFTDTLLGKLNDIEDGAQVNVIEGVKVGGTLLDVTNKSVNIPVANTTALGVVMSSAAQNKIAVAADGTMEVNSLNVNKLVQTDGEFFIMNGGSANI